MSETDNKDKTPEEVIESIERLHKLAGVVTERKLIEQENRNNKGKRSNHVRVTKSWHIAALKEFAIDGANLNKLAEKYGCSKGYLEKLWRSEDGLRVIRQLIDRTDIKLARARIRFLADECIDVLVDILRSNNPDDKPLKKDIALKLLDKAGIGDTQELKITKEYIFKKVADAIEEGHKEAEAEEEAEEAMIEEELDAAVHGS